jgi:hypothetical protein
VIYATHNHHEQAAAALPQVIALAPIAGAWALYLVRYGLRPNGPPEPPENTSEKALDTHQPH